MSSEPRVLPAWLTLAWWYEKDRAVKDYLERPFSQGEPWTPEDDARLVGAIGWVLGVPLLLTPLVTRLLYPWLMQPDELLYYQLGLAGVAIALAARAGGPTPE